MHDCKPSRLSFHILSGLFADMKRSIVNNKNKSFDTSFQHIPFDVFNMVYEIAAISRSTCIEFNSVIWIKQRDESVDFIIGSFVKDLLLLSLHHVCSCYIRLHVQPCFVFKP